MAKPFIADAAFCRLVVEAVAAEMRLPAALLQQPTLPAQMAESWTMARLLAATVAYEVGDDLSFPPMGTLLGMPYTSVSMLAKEGRTRRLGNVPFGEHFERVLRKVRVQMAAATAAA